MQREYAIDKQQRSYENRIRQLKQEERQLRACGMDKEASAVRKKWRRLTKDYQIYSVENNRAYYPYRYVIDRSEVEGYTGKGNESEIKSENAPQQKAIDEIVLPYEQQSAHIFIANSLGTASSSLKDRFDIKSDRIIITDKQYATHIAKGANTHDDIFDRIKDHIPDIINNPDYIFISDKKKDTVIFVSIEYSTQLIVKLNTSNPDLSNTIITVFGCGKSTLKRLKKKLEILYEKSIDKQEKA